jgi:hypothetical protein
MKNKLAIATVLCVSCAAFASPAHVLHSQHSVVASNQSVATPSAVWKNIVGGTYASAYNGGDLFINGSWINADNDLLKIDQTNPLKNSFLLSGDLQALLTSDMTPAPQSSQMALQSIELQSYTTLDHVFHAFTDSMLDPHQLNVTIPRAFITLGDLNRSDFYTTIGKNQVSFGQYSTNVINVLPEISSELGGITVNSVTLGMDNTKRGMNVRAYIYQPNVKTVDHRDAEGGLDFVKAYSYKTVTASTGVSVVSDLADSGAISNVLGNEPLVHRLPAFNIRQSLSLPGNQGIVVEYVAAMTDFSKDNVVTNDKSVRPGALHLEWNKSTTCFNKPVEFALGYNQTYHASAFNLPVSRVYGVATISPIRRSALSLEVNDDQSYSANDVSKIGGNVIGAQDGLAHISVYLLAGIYF